MAAVVDTAGAAAQRWRTQPAMATWPQQRGAAAAWGGVWRRQPRQPARQDRGGRGQRSLAAVPRMCSQPLSSHEGKRWRRQRPFMRAWRAGLAPAPQRQWPVRRAASPGRQAENRLVCATKLVPDPQAPPPQGATRHSPPGNPCEQPPAQQEQGDLQPLPAVRPAALRPSPPGSSSGGLCFQLAFVANAADAADSVANLHRCQHSSAMMCSALATTISVAAATATCLRACRWNPHWPQAATAASGQRTAVAAQGQAARAALHSCRAVRCAGH